MDTLLNFIEQIGHYALFLVLCLGVIGLPVPNEVVAMTGGALAASEILAPFPSFVMLYLGVCSGATVGFMLSRFTASRLLDRFGDKKSIRQFLDVSERLTRQYGNYAICISAFLPILRNVTPYAVGMKGMPYRKFALFPIRHHCYGPWAIFPWACTSAIKWLTISVRSLTDTDIIWQGQWPYSQWPSS